MLPRAAVIANVSGRLLIQHGVNDDIVPLVQSCALAAQLPGMVAYHVDPAGQVVGTAPAACAASGLTWNPGPLPAAWPGSRYLVVYDSLTHEGGLNHDRASLDAVSYLFSP